MIVKSMSLSGFRNYDCETIHFGDGVNVISGKNAQGKTNLIEAVYYLAAGRSFRHCVEKDLISFDCDKSIIKAHIISAEREQTIEAHLHRSRRREIYANSVKLKKVTELTGRLTAVVFGPDDLNMIKDGSAVRRKLMDHSLSQLRPGYHLALTEFNKLYEHKRIILRDYHEKPSLLELLDDYDMQIAQYSAKLIYYRTAFTAGLSRRAALIHNDFSDGLENLTIKYKTIGDIDTVGKKPDEILKMVTARQQELRAAELRSGHILSGAHKDDLEIEINGLPSRKFASQGQARTAAVSIKLAERDIHNDDRGEYPVLLLDDVLSELDPKRQSFILGRITNGQVMITCCDDSAANNIKAGTIIQIDSGKLKVDN